MTNVPARNAGAPAPTRQQLLWTCAATAALAVAILLFAVLPAEYGIDPTGAGRAFGLSRLRGAAPAGEALPSADAGVAIESDAPWKSARVTIELAPGEEMEYKIAMNRDATVLFTWTADAPIDSDFHAEPYGEPEGGAVRYREQLAATASSGALRAPFAGHHGWYWANRGEAPATVTLLVAGYYDALKERRRGARS